MTVINLQAKREQKEKQTLLKEHAKFIGDYILPQLSQDEKLELMTACESKDPKQFADIVHPYIMRFLMTERNK